MPQGSYSVMPPQWSYRPQATGDGLTESMPARVLQRHATKWSYRPQATGGGLTENMPTRVLQHHATAAVLQASWPTEVDSQRARPKGSDSVMPPQWSYRPQATGGGLTESTPPRVLQHHSLLAKTSIDAHRLQEAIPPRTQQTTQ